MLEIAFEVIASHLALAANRRLPGGAGAAAPAMTREQLISKLIDDGVKVSPDKVVRIGMNGSGKIVFLETGNAKGGLEHILLRHGEEFVNAGVARDDIPDLVFRAATEGKIVGYQGADTSRPIFETTYNGMTARVAVTVGDNGYIVGANLSGRLY
jgi:filamentous hemagglutinin